MATGLVGTGVQCLTQSGTTKGLFLCFQITIEVKPDPGNQSRFPVRDKPSGSKNTVNEKKLTFRLLESQNSHKCCVLISSGRPHHQSPRLQHQFINSTQGAAGVSEEGAVLEVRVSPRLAPQIQDFPLPIFLLAHRVMREPLTGFHSDTVVWSARLLLLLLNIP